MVLSLKFKPVSPNTFKFLLFTVVTFVFLVLPASATDNPYLNLSYPVNQSVTITDLYRINLTEPDLSGNYDYLEISGDTFTKHIGRLVYSTDPYVIADGQVIDDVDNFYRLDGNELTKNDDSGDIKIKNTIYESMFKEHIYLNSHVSEIGYKYDAFLIDWTIFDPETNLTYTEPAENSFIGIDYDEWGNVVISVNGAETVVLPVPYAIDAEGKEYLLSWDLDKDSNILKIGDLETLDSAAYPVTVDPTELLTNNGFETGSFSGWSAWKNTASYTSASYTVVSGGNSGNYSALLYAYADAPSSSTYDKSATSYLSQTFSINDSIQVKAYVKTSYSGTGDHIARMVLDPYSLWSTTGSISSWTLLSYVRTSGSVIQFSSYASSPVPFDPSATMNLYVDDVSVKSTTLSPLAEIYPDPDPVFSYFPATIKFHHMDVYGNTYKFSVFGDDSLINETFLTVITNDELVSDVFTVDCAGYDAISGQLWLEEAEGYQLVDSFTVNVIRDYLAYNEDGSYNFNIGDEYNPDSLGLTTYYAREVYEDGTIVYTELDSQSGTITPTYSGGEHGDLVSVTIIEDIAGVENQVIDTLNSTEEFDYIEASEDNSQVWYDFGELWGLPGYTYFVKIFYLPPAYGESWAPSDEVIQVYSQSGYVTVAYPEYFEYAKAYFKVDGEAYLVDETTREDSSAPEVNPDDEEEDDDDLIDNLDTPDAPDGPDSDSNPDSPFPDPLENESENNDTWPEAPNVPEVIIIPTNNETNVTVVTDNTTSGYYASVNDSIGSLFAPFHAFANYVASPFDDAAGSLYIVSSSLRSQDLSDSQEVADTLGSGVKSVYPWYFRVFGDVVICLAIISMILRGSNEA